MDAKPLRPVPRLGDENRIPPSNKSVHQRHKSTGNLITKPATAMNITAKRTALADKANAGNTFALNAADLATINGKSTVDTVMKQQQENEKLNDKPKEAILQPAQRPRNKPGAILPVASMSNLSTFSKDPLLRSKPSAVPKNTKSKVAIYTHLNREKEQEPGVDYPTFDYLSKKATSAPDSSKPITLASDSKQSAPAPSETAKEIIPSISSLLPSQILAAEFSGIQKPQMQGPRHRHSQPALGINIPAPRRESSSHSHGGIESAYKPCPMPVAEEDMTEAPYLDAVEELHGDEQWDHYQVHIAPEEPLVAVASLPESVEASKAPTNRESRVAFNPHLLPIDDQAYLSESDDPDYYEDAGYATAHSFRSHGDTTTGGCTTVMFPPRLTDVGQAELLSARAYVESRRTDEDIQEDDWDISMVAEYGDEIFAYMKEVEMTLLPNAHYMDKQTEIKWSMRSILMDWVIQVHGRFGLLPETLFLTVNFIDRFLSNKVVSLNKLQLVGATAIFLAAKYEEINCPSVSEIVYMVDHAYTIEEILKAERFMLSMLDFELGWPGPMSFLRRISKADDYDLETRTVAKYFLEVTIMDERFVSSPPSYIAAGAHCLSRLILNKGDWTPAHVHYSGYTYAQLKPIVSMLLECCRTPQTHHLVVYDKYADKRYKRASVYVATQLKIGFCLPFSYEVPYYRNGELFEGSSTHSLSNSQQEHFFMPIPAQG
ncbi:cyclin-like protein [Xylariomycetidae sp. FL2044]|nr:cyclin-like protein [Xylariomycetidae sp. FL2044]